MMIKREFGPKYVRFLKSHHKRKDVVLERVILTHKHHWPN
jgi:hypothetical protein